MARTEDVTWRNYRKVHRAMNERLAKAEREGRLEDELRIIERDGMRFYRQIMAEGATSTKRPRRTGKARHATA